MESSQKKTEPSKGADIVDFLEASKTSKPRERADILAGEKGRVIVLAEYRQEKQEVSESLRELQELSESASYEKTIAIAYDIREKYLEPEVLIRDFLGKPEGDITADDMDRIDFEKVSRRAEVRSRPTIKLQTTMVNFRWGELQKEQTVDAVTAYIASEELIRREDELEAAKK